MAGLARAVATPTGGQPARTMACVLLGVLALLGAPSTAASATGPVDTSALGALRNRVRAMPGEIKPGGYKQVWLEPGELGALRKGRKRAGRVLAEEMQGPREHPKGHGPGRPGSFRAAGTLADMLDDVEHALANDTARIAPPGDLRAMFDLSEEENLALLRDYGYSLGVMERWSQKTYREFLDESCVDGEWLGYEVYPSTYIGTKFTFFMGECIFKQVPDITYLPITYEVHFDKYNGLRLGADVPDDYLYQEPLVTYYPLLDCVAPSFEIEPAEYIHAYLQPPIKVNKFCIFLFGDEKFKGGRDLFLKFGDDRDCPPDGCEKVREHLIEDVGLPRRLVDPPWVDFDVPRADASKKDSLEAAINDLPRAFRDFNRRIAEDADGGRPAWLRAAMPGLSDLPPWLAEAGARLPRFLDPRGLTDPRT